MSVLFYPESIRILGSDANGNNVMLCEMAVDDIANLPAANAFISDGYVLSMGCKAIVINDNSKHRMNSQGQWVQIAAGTSTYTRAEIDAMISVIDDTKLTANDVWGAGAALSANTDLNDIITIGRYFCAGSSIGNTLVNSPTIQPFVITVSAFQSANNRIQHIESLNLSTFSVEIYERMKISSGWKSWYKFEGTGV